MKTMKLEIVTPHGLVYDADVAQVTLPGKEGEFGVLPEHAALVSLLDAGVIAIDIGNKKEINVAINGGYVKVDENKVSCIVDGAVALSDDDGQLSARLDEAKELLKKAETSSTAIATAVGKVESIAKLR
jgi:F-type H+-transporting ATPase subunit epsilon